LAGLVLAHDSSHVPQLSAWAYSIAPADAEVGTRRSTLRVELRRAGIRSPEIQDGQLGGEPALVALYDYDGKPHPQLSAVRDGIEYRISLAARSTAERTEILRTLSGAFEYPTAAVAAQVRDGLPRALNAQASRSSPRAVAA